MLGYTSVDLFVTNMNRKFLVIAELCDSLSHSSLEDDSVVKSADVSISSHSTSAKTPERG